TTWLVNPEREPLANSSCSTWCTRTARSDPTAGFRARRSAVSKATNRPGPLSKNRTRRSRQSPACHAARSRASVALARKRPRPNFIARSADSAEYALARNGSKRGAFLPPAKRGERPVSSLKGASRQMAQSMSEKQLEEFAHTKRKGLPRKKQQD